MKLLPLYSSQVKQYLTDTQIQTLKILIWLLTVQKTVKIERLSACFPLPIRYESRRKHLQRFLSLSALSLSLFWFPIIKLIIEKEFARGTRIFLSNIHITKNQGFGYFNLAGYWKRKYKNKVEKEPWYLLTNLDNLDEIIKLYRQRMGIEAMFKDCKTGGYNLEGSQANTQRLTNLILLIALAYTTSVLKGKSIKNSGHQKYIARLTETQRAASRHSNFWLGLYGELWIIAWDFLVDLVRDMMNLSPQKILSYQRGIRAMSLIKMI